MARTRGRNQLAKNDSTREEQAQLKKPLKLYPGVGNYAGDTWNFAGICDSSVFPSPFQTGWGNGWVAEQTRRQMLCHPKIYQSINILIDAIIGDGGRWVPGLPPSDPGFAEARLYAEFMEYIYRNVQGSYYQVARQLLASVHEGNKIAAINAVDETSTKFGTKRVLESLQIIPNGMYWYQIDEQGHIAYVRVNNQAGQDELWHPEKFMILCFRPVNNNPYGTSILSPAYEPFYRDIQLDGEEMAYLAQFSRPSVVIEAPAPSKELGYAQEELKPLRDRSGKIIMVDDPDNPGQMIEAMGTIVDQNGILISRYESGSYFSVDAGSKIYVVQANTGGGDLFRLMRDANGRLMSGAILGTHQVTDSERNVSTNNGEVGEGILGLNITSGKMMLEKADEDLAYRFIEMNYGTKAAKEKLPIRDYGSGQNGRVPALYNSVVNFITSGAFDKQQYWFFCLSNQLPMPYPGEEPVVQPGASNGAGGAAGKGAPNAN